jgi:hypothetical protein
MIELLEENWKEVLVTKETNIDTYFCCWSKILSSALREEHRLRMFESRKVVRILTTMGQELAEGWTKLHNINYNYVGKYIQNWITKRNEWEI